MSELPLPEVSTLFFGMRWDAPMLDNAARVATPVGAVCLHCAEPIEDGDQGVMRPYLTETDGYAARGEWRPAHRECDLRSMVGSVAHLEGRCVCDGGHDTGGTEEVSWRQQGRDVMAWLAAHAV